MVPTASFVCRIDNAVTGYDGGDCCDCTCVSTTAYTCGDSGYDCVDPDSSCDVDYVEAGTKTTVTASANAYDERPGADSDSNGCFMDGCEPSLTRDGITDDVESRWSCAAKIVPGELECAIDFIFEDPQDIKDVQVSFYKGDERSRSLQVRRRRGASPNIWFVVTFENTAL